MKLPMPPPDLDEDQFPAIARFVVEHRDWIARANERYWAWDELRRRPRPDGYGAPEVWQAVDMVRRGASKEVPLTNGRGGPWRVLLTDPAIQMLLTIEGAVADPLRLAESALGAGSRARFLQSALIEEAVLSSILEGAGTTRERGKQLLRSRRRPLDHGERMIVNNLRTIEMLRDVADEAMTPELLRHIHRTVSKDTLESERDEGRLQQPGEERVRVIDPTDDTVVYVPPPAEELRERVDRLCDFANATDPYFPPTVRAILLHFQLAMDHPFVDGNGRTARALYYWSMLHSGYELAQYPSISAVIRRAPKRYSRAYVHAEQTGDATFFVLYHLDVLRRAADEFARYVGRKIEERRRADAAVEGWAGLNLRQRLLLRRCLDAPSQLLVPAEEQARFVISRPTILKDLAGLVDAGLLLREPAGRGFHYRPVDDLRDRLDAGPDARDPDAQQTLDFDA